MYNGHEIWLNGNKAAWHQKLAIEQMTATLNAWRNGMKA